MFIIIETIENEERFVSAIPNTWIINGVLYWPPSSKNVAKLCAKEAIVEIKEWKPYNDFIILQTDIPTFDEARIREKYYSIYTNTDSEVEALKLRATIRDHPINFRGGALENDLNEMFDKEKKSSSTRTDDFESQPQIASNDPTSTMIELNHNKIDNPEEIKSQCEYKVTKINKNELKRKKQQPTSIANEKFHKSKNNFSKTKKTKMEKISDLQKQTFPEETTKIKKNEKTVMLNFLKLEIRAQSEKIENMSTELEKLKTGVSVLTELMQSFCASMNKASNTVKEDPLFQMTGLPLRNISDIKRFNDLLLDEDYLQQVAIRLAKILSTTMSLNKMVKMCVEKIMCYDILLLRSWSGKSGISAKAARSKLAFNEYGSIIALIKLTINNVKEVLDENLKKSLVEVLKRSSQNKIREGLKLAKKQQIQPATSTSFNAAEDSTETEMETDNSSDTEE